jgi:SAM-dependent methyltransferase
VGAPSLTPLAAAVLHVPSPPERALAIAFDGGDAALFLAREFPAARVRGADSSAERVAAARARAGLDPEGRIAFKQGTPGRLPYPDGFFELVAQLDGRPAPGELARVLAPGGHLILARNRLPGFGTGLRERRLRWRLAGHGFEPIAAADAGDGNFLVARLEWRV